MNILIIEDCLPTAMMLESFVSASGHRPICVPVQWLGSSPADQWAVDLVLLDIVLPGADGYEVAAWLRDQGLRAPIVAVTATEDDPIKRQQYGIDGYLAKPASIEELKAVLEQLQLAINS